MVLNAPYDVEVFIDGSAMLEHLASHEPPDVLVLDWIMPGVTGIEVCRFLRAGSAARPHLAILLLTMQTRTDDIVEGLAAGANDYLVKPYADPELLARVDALVRWNGLLERAQKAEASVLQLLEHAPDPLITIDRRNRISYVNAEAQRVLGRSAADLQGLPVSDVLPTLPTERVSDAARTSLPLMDLALGEQIFSPTVRALPSSVDASLTIALRDVTARRQKEARRLDFYSIIAHDLRSPLGAMLMRTDLMLRGHRGVLSSEMVGDLRKLDANMRRLVALINDFLDFARMEEAGHKMERARVDLAALIAEVLDEFRPLLESTHQELQLDLGNGEVTALGDRSRIQQVVMNLLANAIKFSPPGGRIGVRARLAGDWCEVAVEDNGPGIPAEVLPALFQRYSRAPSSRVQTSGTGLGLLIVREIVEAHGGTVGVESVVGRGSRFWVRIPSAEPLAPERTAPPAASTSP
ncbi:MAG: Phytochrome, two-component sensor histidine kinase, partial [Myxococcales bacterium]|nr:Phytochrome, two-component sensor histidine kinase [Myxococcales bacterium]